MKKILILLGVALLLVPVLAMAGTPDQFRYGIYTPRVYDWDATNWTKGAYYLDIPTLSANDTFCGLTTTQTLTNKTLTSPTITGGLSVANGGTGVETLLDHGIVVGSGTGDVTVLAVGTNGQVLVGSAGNDPVFANISAGTGIAVSEGAGTIGIAVSGATVPVGGTGVTSITDHEIVLGSGTAAVSTVGLTTGQVLMGTTGSDPAGVTPTAGTGIAITANGTTLEVSVSGATVAVGGTGATTLTNHGILLGSGTDAITPTAVMTNGQILVGSSGADPAPYTLNADTGLTATVGAGTLELDLDTGWSAALPAVIEVDYTHTSASGASQGYTVAVASGVLTAGKTIRITARGNCGGATGTVSEKSVAVGVDGAPFARLVIPIASTGDFVWRVQITGTGTNGQNISSELALTGVVPQFDATTDTTNFTDGSATDIGLIWKTAAAQDTIAIYDTVVEWMP